MFQTDFVQASPAWFSEYQASDSLYEIPINGTFGGALAQDIKIFREQDVTIRVTMRDRGGDLQDVTDWALRFDVFKRSTGNVALTQNASFFEIDDAANGAFSMNLGNAATANMTVGEYAWQIWRVDTGQNYVLAWGAWTLQL